LQQNLQTIGIKLDVQNYPSRMFFDSFLPEGKASPSMGAMTSRYDIAEFEDGMGYDPDDSWLLACDQIPPKGTKNNIAFYCNPALDSLYKQELATADPGLRQQIFHQIHDLYLTEFPFIVLYSPPDIAMVRKGTHNYLPGPIGAEETINIWEWWCDNGKC
jgi:peptide/nickel transport system substrate-binding protein